MFNITSVNNTIVTQEQEEIAFFDFIKEWMPKLAEEISTELGLIIPSNYPTMNMLDSLTMKTLGIYSEKIDIYAAYSPVYNEIVVNDSYFIASNTRNRLKTLAHEMTHWFQFNHNTHNFNLNEDDYYDNYNSISFEDEANRVADTVITKLFKKEDNRVFEEALKELIDIVS